MARFVLIVTSVMLMLSMSQAFQTNVPYPDLGTCNKQLIDMSKGFWALRGQKNDMLPTMELQNYLVVFSTFDQLQGIKCMRVNSSLELSTFNIYFYQSDGCGPALLGFKNVVENGGKLTMEGQNGKKIAVYPMTVDANAISYYACSPDSTALKTPLLVVLSNTKYVDNTWIKTASDLMTLYLNTILGKNLASIFTYGNECLFG